MLRRAILGLIGLAFVVLVSSGSATAQSRCTPNWSGKYSGYVLKMYVPEDLRQYGRCNDYGRWNGSAYKGRTVPTGSYWVYVYPYWYVWRVRGYKIQNRGGPIYRISAPVPRSPAQ